MGIMPFQSKFLNSKSGSQKKTGINSGICVKRHFHFVNFKRRLRFQGEKRPWKSCNVRERERERERVEGLFPFVSNIDFSSDFFLIEFLLTICEINVTSENGNYVISQ